MRKLSIPTVNPGTFLVIRVDGSEEVVKYAPNLTAVRRAIGCDSIDTVILTCYAAQPDIVMCVDETGMIDDKPINTKATKLYHSICRPGTPYSIHGDVALFHDGEI